MSKSQILQPTPKSQLYIRYGLHNDITDVPGVKVGHETLYKKLNDTDVVCSGVTTILPHKGNLFENKVAAASFVLNGFGKTIGLVQVEELGVIESPIMLTNTFSVASALQGTLQYMLDSNPAIGDSTSSLNIVVGECNDSHLNSMRLCYINPTDAITSITNAIEHDITKPIQQGDIGAGKGMICYDMKGGIGSSSRIISFKDLCDRGDFTDSQTYEYNVGVMVLSNFGNKHEIKLQHWLEDHKHTLHPNTQKLFQSWRDQSVSDVGDTDEKTSKDDRDNGAKEISNVDDDNNNHSNNTKPDGSVIILIAVDAPINERQLKRLCKRAAIGLGRTGTYAHNGSGDIMIAFSTQTQTLHTSSNSIQQDHFEKRIQLRDGKILDRIFEGVVEATEEAVYNSLFHARTTFGRQKRVIQCVDHKSILQILDK